MTSYYCTDVSITILPSGFDFSNVKMDFMLSAGQHKWQAAKKWRDATAKAMKMTSKHKYINNAKATLLRKNTSKCLRGQTGIQHAKLSTAGCLFKTH